MAIGWRARVGVMIPSVNATLEPEFYQVAPPGITFHFTRMGLTEITEDSYHKMLADVPRGVRHLADAGVDLIIFGCTSGSLLGGLGYDQRIVEVMQQECQVPCMTTSTAVVEALRHLGLGRIAVATPYVKWVDEKLEQFLQLSGFTVAEIQGMPLPKKVHSLNREMLYPFIQGFRSLDQVDGLLLGCTGMRTLESLEQLEQDLGKPVVSSNQATLWKCLTMLGASDPIPGWGELLRQPRPHRSLTSVR